MKNWQKKEKEDKKDFQGKLQVGSGRNWKNKLDVKSDLFLIECKTTERESYGLKLALWEKVRKAAILEGRTPLLSLRFINGNNDRDLIILDKNDFILLTN